MTLMKRFDLNQPARPVEAKAFEWMRINPEFLQEFAVYAVKIRETGKRKYRAYTICELLRWESDVTTRGDETFKINRNHIPFIARYILELLPQELPSDFFAKRELDQDKARTKQRIKTTTEAMQGWDWVA